MPQRRSRTDEGQGGAWEGQGQDNESQLSNAFSLQELLQQVGEAPAALNVHALIAALVAMEAIDSVEAPELSLSSLT
jgi:hypothetical protein